MKFTEFSRIIFADSKNTMQINTLEPSVQGFDSLHPLHASTRKYTVFLSEGQRDKPATGREIGHSITLFSRIFCGVSA